VACQDSSRGTVAPQPAWGQGGSAERLARSGLLAPRVDLQPRPGSPLRSARRTRHSRYNLHARSVGSISSFSVRGTLGSAVGTALTPSRHAAAPPGHAPRPRSIAPAQYHRVPNHARKDDHVRCGRMSLRDSVLPLAGCGEAVQLPTPSGRGRRCMRSDVLSAACPLVWRVRPLQSTFARRAKREPRARRR